MDTCVLGNVAKKNKKLQRNRGVLIDTNNES